MEDNNEYYFIDSEIFNVKDVFEHEILFYPHTFSDCFRSLEPEEKKEEKIVEYVKKPKLTAARKFKFTTEQIITFGNFLKNK